VLIVSQCVGVSKADEPTFRITQATSAADNVCKLYEASIRKGIGPNILAELPAWTWFPVPDAQKRFAQIDLDNDGTIDTLVSEEDSLGNAPNFSSLWIVRSFGGPASAALALIAKSDARVDPLALNNFPVAVDGGRFAPSRVFNWTPNGFALPNKSTFRIFSNVDVAVWPIAGHNYLAVFHRYNKNQKYQNAMLVEYDASRRLTPLCAVSLERK
jgi:hypothetical protein